MASVVESGFGVCKWDGSQGRLETGWPFLQSLLNAISIFAPEGHS
jgi:hypothetical protein